MNLFRSLTLKVKQIFGLKSSKPEVQIPEVSPTIITPDESPILKDNRGKFTQAGEIKAEVDNPVSKICPHGKRREYCPICDRKGYESNFGDWRSD